MINILYICTLYRVPSGFRTDDSSDVDERLCTMIELIECFEYVCNCVIPNTVDGIYQLGLLWWLLSRSFFFFFSSSVESKDGKTRRMHRFNSPSLFNPPAHKHSHLQVTREAQIMRSLSRLFQSFNRLGTYLKVV